LEFDVTFTLVTTRRNFVRTVNAPGGYVVTLLLGIEVQAPNAVLLLAVNSAFSHWYVYPDPEPPLAPETLVI
jgi:hypothetical protein